jgi:hypothetical protein
MNMTILNLEPKFRFWALKAFWTSLSPEKIPLHIKFPTILILEPKFRFRLGGLTCISLTPKGYLSLLYIRFPIDGCITRIIITRPYWFWSPNSVFGLWGLIFIFLTPERIFSQIPILGSEGLILYFWPSKGYLSLLHIKIPIDGYITRPYWFWSPNSVFVRAYFCIFDPKTDG